MRYRNNKTYTDTRTHHRIQCDIHFHDLLFRVNLLHLDPNPTVRIHRYVRFYPNLLNGSPSWAQRPRNWRLSLGIRVHVQRYFLEGLNEANDYRRRFVVCELLSETNPWSGIERKEDEGVWDKVLLDSFIQEPVRVEVFRCRGWKLLTSHEEYDFCKQELTIGTPQIFSSLH